MNCQHTGKQFTIETESVTSPRLVVLKGQVEQVKAALTATYVPFIIDYEGYRSMGKIFCTFSFRPDADISAIEATLLKAQ
jgi:hypothetical protein